VNKQDITTELFPVLHAHWMISFPIR